jgi:hypothetical protein
MFEIRPGALADRRRLSGGLFRLLRSRLGLLAGDVGPIALETGGETTFPGGTARSTALRNLKLG